MKVNIRRLAAVSLLLFCLATGLIAQVDTGVLSGTIFDAVVPGVKVTLTNIGTNYSLELKPTPRGCMSPHPCRRVSIGSRSARKDFRRQRKRSSSISPSACLLISPYS